MSKVLFVHFNKYTRSLKFLFNEHVLVWKKERDFSFRGNINDWIWSISKYLEFTTFSGSICCSEEELLNWLNNKSVKLGGRTVFIGGFNAVIKVNQSVYIASRTFRFCWQ